MQKLIKCICLMITVLLVMLVSCCGFSQIKKIEGNWTLSTINGVTPEVYFAALGYPLPSLSRNMEISAGKIVVYGADVDNGESYGIKAVSGGYEALEGDKVMGTIIYSEENDSLTLTPSIPDAEKFEFVLKRGTYNYEES